VTLLLLFPLAGRAGRGATLVLAGVVLCALLALSVRRLHDRGKSPAWLALLLVPLVGPLWLGIELAFAAGTAGENRYGADPLASSGDYLTVKW